MKTSRILAAWVLSLAAFGVWFYLTFFEIELPMHLDGLWADIIGQTGMPFDRPTVFAVTATFIVMYGPALTLSFVFFAHVLPGGLVISLRGIMLGIALAAVCLALAAVEGQSATAAWFFCGFSIAVTVGGLGWLCWQGRRTRRDAEASLPSSS